MVAAGRRLTPRGRERRSQLITLATTLFATKGYHPTSVADIVDGLGVGKGVFYWYFDSKEELFVEILREAQKDLRRRQQKALAETENAVERLSAGIRASVLWSAEHHELARLFEFAVTDETFAPVIRAGRTQLVNATVARLKDAIAEGGIPDGDPEQLAHAIFGVSSLLTTEYIHHRGEPPGDIAETVVRFCLGGLGAR